MPNMHTMLMHSLVFAYILFSTLTFTQTTIVPPPYLNAFKYFFKYQLPDLPYDYGDLEPFIQEDTVKTHHQGHHLLYTQKMNAALTMLREDHPNLKDKSVVDLLLKLRKVPAKHQKAIQNFGGGFFNHNLYWGLISPNADKEKRSPGYKLQKDIEKSFGSFEAFHENFTDEANKLFGSGYVWLVRKFPDPHDSSSDLHVITTANQDCPISHGYIPILVIDVWEHAYYLKHQYRRTAYVNDWWYLVDWQQVDSLDDWWHTWFINTPLHEHAEL